MIDKQREQIRQRDRELSQKSTEIENVRFCLDSLCRKRLNSHRAT